MTGPAELHGVRHLMQEGGAMPEQPLPPGVVELTAYEAHGCQKSKFWETERALYALGARRGYEAGLEAAAKVCERIADEYQEREGRRYPELRSDANQGASSCEHAIRQLKEQQ